MTLTEQQQEYLVQGLLTDEGRFKVWLDSLPAEEVFACTADAGACPISEYLFHEITKEVNRELKYLFVNIYINHTGIVNIGDFDTNIVRFSLPPWVITFIQKLNETYGVLDITPTQAKQVLNTVQNDTQP